jgi:hypothetical protein
VVVLLAAFAANWPSVRLDDLLLRPPVLVLRGFFIRCIASASSVGFRPIAHAHNAYRMLLGSRRNQWSAEPKRPPNDGALSEGEKGQVSVSLYLVDEAHKCSMASLS